jgi:hypothetical protein
MEKGGGKMNTFVVITDDGEYQIEARASRLVDGGLLGFLGEDNIVFTTFNKWIMYYVLGDARVKRWIK